MFYEQRLSPAPVGDNTAFSSTLPGPLSISGLERQAVAVTSVLPDAWLLFQVAKGSREVELKFPRSKKKKGHEILLRIHAPPVTITHQPSKRGLRLRRKHRVSVSTFQDTVTSNRIRPKSRGKRTAPSPFCPWENAACGPPGCPHRHATSGPSSVSANRAWFGWACLGRSPSL